MGDPVHRIEPGTGIGWGATMASIGIFVLLVAVGIVPADEAGMRAPRWVVALAGLVFLVGGAVVLGYGIRNALDPGAAERPDPFPVGAWFAASAIVTIFAVLGAWVALGSDEPDAETRIAFGLGGLVSGATAAWWWVHGVRRIVRGRHQE